MKNKICSRCKLEKSLDEFNVDSNGKYKRQSWCKQCYHDDYIKNREYKLSQGKEIYYSKSKDYHKNRKAKWRAENITYYRKYNTKYMTNRVKNDLNFRLQHRLRLRLNQALHGKIKAGSAVRDLGCSIEEFKKYIANKFTEGMSWDNWGKWHLDHIKPLTSFDLTDRAQWLEACNYMNYQPLWAIDNIRKGNHIT